MRKIQVHPEEARTKGEKARIDMVERYSEDVFGTILEREISKNRPGNPKTESQTRER